MVSYTEIKGATAEGGVVCATEMAPFAEDGDDTQYGLSPQFPAAETVNTPSLVALSTA